MTRIRTRMNLAVAHGTGLGCRRGAPGSGVRLDYHDHPGDSIGVADHQSATGPQQELICNHADCRR